MKNYAEYVFPDLLSPSDRITASLGAASQEKEHLQLENATYGTLGNMPAAFWILNLSDFYEMQAIAVLEFEEVAGRRNNRKSNPQKGSIFF